MFIQDNMKDSIVAKLASQCEDLYGESLKVFQRENLKHIWEKDWIPLVNFMSGFKLKIITIKYRLQENKQLFMQ
jgi:hypothetical protein